MKQKEKQFQVIMLENEEVNIGKPRVIVGKKDYKIIVPKEIWEPLEAIFKKRGKTIEGFLEKEIGDQCGLNPYVHMAGGAIVPYLFDYLYEDDDPEYNDLCDSVNNIISIPRTLWQIQERNKYEQEMKEAKEHLEQLRREGKALRKRDVY